MSKKIINIILLFFLISSGFIRAYIFYNIHYAEVYIQGKYEKSYTDSWLQWMDQLSMSEMYYLRWGATLLFIVISFLITYALIKYNFAKYKGVILLFSGLFVFSALTYLISLLEVPYTFQISRRTLHFLQSPLPAAVLFLFYKYILPLQNANTK